MTTATAQRQYVDQEAPSGNRVPIDMGKQGLEFKTLEDMYRFAQYIANAEFCPKPMRERPGDVLCAIQFGAEIGLPPMASVQRIAVINGRPTLWGDAMLAVCQRSSRFDFDAFEERWEGSGETRKAICTVGRKGSPKTVTRTFGASDAKRIGLAGRETYRLYPDRMYQMRARAHALRDLFPDVLCGLYAVEEMLVDQAIEGLDLNPQRQPFEADRTPIEDVRKELEGATGTGDRDEDGHKDEAPQAESASADDATHPGPDPPKEPEPPKPKRGRPKKEPESASAVERTRVLGTLRNAIIHEFDELDMPDQAQLLVDGAKLFGMDKWPTIYVIMDKSLTAPEPFKKLLEKIRERAK